MLTEPTEYLPPLTPQERLAVLTHDLDILDGLSEQSPDSAPFSSDDMLAMLRSAETLVAESASDLETGLRRKTEKDRYEQSFTAYKRALGHVAVDQTMTDLAQIGSNPDMDVDRAKQNLFNFLHDSKLNIVNSDINRRLEISRVERMKQRVVKTTVSRLVGKVVLTGALGGVTYEVANMAQETASPLVKATGVAIVAVVFRSQIRAGFRMFGQVLKSRINGSIDFYSSPELRKIMKQKAEEAAMRGGSLDQEAVHSALADYHMRSGINEMSRLILQSNLQEKTKANVQDVVAVSVQSIEDSLDDFYGIRKPEPNAVQRWLKRLRRDKQPEQANTN